jgi:hypothetical protein
MMARGSVKIMQAQVVHFFHFINQYVMDLVAALALINFGIRRIFPRLLKNQ